MSRNCANPLLRDWVKEWMDQAQAIQSKAYYTYKKAYDSLDKCTESFDHPSQAITLAGIGPGMTQKLEERMVKYCKENGLPTPQRPGKSKKRGNADIDDLEDTSTPIRKTKTKPYVPKYRTGGYGILLCLLDFHSVGRENISKEQICRVAQADCDSSYTLPEPGKQYTAWSNMKTLLEKGYTYKRGSPAKYSLTETGIDIAKRLKESGVQATGDSSQAGPSTSRVSINEDVLESFHRNPSTARASSRRRNGAAAILDQMSESYDPSADEVDMSLYVLNPSQHQSISINGRTAGNGVSTTSSSSTSTAAAAAARAIEINDGPDTSQSSVGANGSAKRQKTATGTGAGIGRGRGRGRGTSSSSSSSSSSSRGKSKGGRAASYLDMLGDMGELDTGPDMSQYVLNPSEHQSISVNGRTSHNNGTASTTSTARLNSSQTKSTIRPDVVPAVSSLSSSYTNLFSSITNSNRTSFARRLMSAAANENSDDEISISSPSTHVSSPKTKPAPKKYTTPSSSHILKKFDKRRSDEDDDHVDLTPSSLPTLQSSQIIPADNIVVDLLSSPEVSPVLPPAHEPSSFPTNFDLENDYFPVSQSLTKKITDETFHYTYLNSTGDAVRSSAKAVITVDESNHCLAYQIRFYTDQRDHPKCKDVIQVSTDDTHIGCSIGYISEFGMESICPGLPSRPVLPLHREEPDSFWPESHGEIESSQRSVNSMNSQQPSQHGYSPTSFSRPSSQQLLGSHTGFSSQPLGSQTSFSSQTQTEPVDYSQLVENTSLECFLPDEYEIVLVLDNREVQMKTDRAYFQRKLAEKGVTCVTRSLDLGDVIWVARKKNSSSNESEELFLDYVIERKRLDDLITSIKDGRYTEQKTRLRVCGAEKVIYLVEEYNREAVVNQSVLAVQTAMSSLQITEGFYLRRTDSIDETITFLVSATKLMNRIYQGRTLYSIPGDIITRQNYLDLKNAFKEKHDGEKSAFLIKYPLYGELNSKNGSTTVGEVYLRMLMTIRGVNMERATSLSKIYPTPHALLKAFQGKTEEEGKRLAKDVTRTHIARRRWTTTASEQLYNVWGAGTYPEPVGDDEYDDY
ncbi:hypothetical protein BD770DRAFT_395057 [Pilaira anomala]|nr:hypothetical protein BD770DRAFT_395057 [Pilaira anomala]